MKAIKVKGHAEEVALFRSTIIGALVCKEMTKGELKCCLFELSKQRYRAPDSDHTRRYAVSTLERWYYRFKDGGLDALMPRRRRDYGKSKKLSPELLQLLVDIRREHPSAAAALIVRTLQSEGRLSPETISSSAVQRLFQREGLPRRSAREATKDATTRLRWEAARPGALWHGDVCHLKNIVVGNEKKAVRVHALMDDASRFVITMQARHQEREEDMLELLVAAVRKHGPPDALYLDNGSTYRGDILRVVCGRLGISLLHARPHDPQARGKMERFWRTGREQCFDFFNENMSLHDINVRLIAYLDESYHKAPHAGLLGNAPGVVYREVQRAPDDLDEHKLREALTVRLRRRVRSDSTVSVDGVDWELDHGYLAGQTVTAARCLLEKNEAPWIEHEGKQLSLHAVDKKLNASMKRPPRLPPSMLLERPEPPPEFDPNKAAMDRLFGTKKGGAK